MSKRYRFWKRLVILAVASMMLALFGVSVHAQDDGAATPTEEEAAPVEEAAPTAETAVQISVDEVSANVTNLQISVDTIWVLLTGFLVFFMQTGFAMLEAGLVKQTGVVNALLENFIDAGLTAIIFWAVGFGVAFGTDSGGVIGTDNFFLSKAISINEGTIIYHTIAEANPDVAYPNLTVLTFFFFQFAFAATASTITTGAMAERTDYIGDLIYTGLMAAITYPVIVHWVWGGGWLFDRGFHDFAGSTVVHTVGGVTALVGAWMLGPRPNRVFGQFPPAHNLGLATIGTMILWFGWYGFNPGSTLGAGNTGLIGLVILNTTLGAGAGAVTTMLLVYFRTGKWDLVFTLNGSLAGLVAVTAGCAFVMPWAAIAIGFVAGILVYFAVEFIESLKIDDPVGAFSVHGVCGIWGTLAIGIFGDAALTFGDAAGKGGLLAGGGADLLIVQLTGSAATIIFIAVASFIMFGALNAIGRLRVDPVADVIGIDAYEHGVSVWPDILPMPSLVLSEKSSPAAKAQTSKAPGSAGD
jgi:ammonium transporter, Amt family